MSSITSETVHALRRALWMVFVVSVGGVLFSGVLSFRELTSGVASCTIGGAPAAIFGVPVCVYGLIMYAALTAISGLTLFRTRARLTAAMRHAR
jgi:hypothetical protein